MLDVNTRDQQYQIEKHTLSPLAYLSETAEPTRIYKQDPHPYRTSFQRDRDRIIHSRAFRRLKHKRQVFLVNFGDHYRTRLTHTMEVAQLSRTIARALRLNEDLAEAIALGHDLGHTPFGHLGEIILNEILVGTAAQQDGFPSENYGGFKHNYQSLRVVDLLEEKYAHPGLNLTGPVREGMLKHTRLKRESIHYPDIDVKELYIDVDFATTVEGQIVAIADEIAQRTHDLEDGIRAGIVSVQDIKELKIAKFWYQNAEMHPDTKQTEYQQRNHLITGLINILVNDVIHKTLANMRAYQQANATIFPINKMLVGFSEQIDPMQKELNKFIYKKIIFVPEVQRGDEQTRSLLMMLFYIFSNYPEFLPTQTLQKIETASLADKARTICDHIAGMTDNFAAEQYLKISPKIKLPVNINLDQILPFWVRQ